MATAEPLPTTPPPPPSPDPTGNKVVPILGAILILLVYAGVAYLAIRFGTKRASMPSVVSVSPTPTPTPRPLPAGKQTYRLSHGKDVIGPKPQTVTIDPLDPTKGAEQTITVIMSPQDPAASIAALLQTDHKNAGISFAPSSIPNEWIGTWAADDSYLYTYYLKFTIHGASGTFEGGLRFR